MEVFDMKGPFSTKSLLPSLCQREEFPLIKGFVGSRGKGVVDPSLAKRGAGRFFN
jgi:hypothetical protein